MEKSKLYLRPVISLLVMFVCSMAAIAAEFTLNNIKALEQTEATLEVGLNNSGTNIIAFQFDLTLPEGVSVLKDTEGKYLVESTSRLSNHSVAVSYFTEGNFYRVAVYSATNKKISSTKGTLLSFKLALDIAPGEYKALLNNIVITNNKLEETKLESLESLITVEARFIPVSEVVLSQTEVQMFLGDEMTLTATILPENASDKTITWSSSEAEIATVDNEGLIKANAVGTAKITATCGEVSAVCNVTVLPIEVTSITLSQSEVTLHVGETSSLTATVAPENATDKTLNWSSSATSIATVDAAGNITAVSVGEATVTATAGNGVNSTCLVKVIATPSEGVTLDKVSISLIVGESAILKATVLPETATDKTVKWSTSDAAVAIVDQTGKVTALTVGSAKVTATNGDNSAVCEITVLPIEVTCITLSQSEVTLHVGETSSLTATVTPENATDKTLSWNSSNLSVATVDASGNITAVSVGEATITATAVNGVKSTCQVKVIATPSEGVTLDKASISLIVGESAILKATVLPETATDKSVKWSTSEESVAMVDETGKVTAISVGNAKITATNGDNSAVCEVTVLPIEVTGITLSQNEVNLHVGETATLDAKVTPSNATDPTIEWSSSDESVATVDSDGQIEAKGEGVALVTATCGAHSARCQVIVTRWKQLIIWDQNFEDVHQGDTIELTAKSSSELEIVYYVLAGDCQIEGNQLTVNSVGEVKIKATQPGNYMYSPAEDVVRSFVSVDGIMDIIMDIDTTCVYYTISGVRVEAENLQPGLYIRQQGNTITKVYVK